MRAVDVKANSYRLNVKCPICGEKIVVEYEWVGEWAFTAREYCKHLKGLEVRDVYTMLGPETWKLDETLFKVTVG